MQITRLARLNRIPGERIITKGGQFRFQMSPQLAEWIRVMRRRPTKVTRLESDSFILGCRARRGPRQGNTPIILNEMKSYTREILACVKEIQDHVAFKKYEEVLLRTLHQCIMALIERDYEIRKIPQNAEAQPDAHDPET
jgi:hypothetical protein